MRVLVLALLCCLHTIALLADDGAASIAAGGLVLMKREPRIVMAKEVLEIGGAKVVVDYEFRNDSDEDITTVVAFPVPSYKFANRERSWGNPGFDDFKLMVGGTPVKFTVEARAFVGKREITAQLNREHIDVTSFGHAETATGVEGPPRDLERTAPAGRQRLIAIGAFKDGYPNWRVEKKYYWTQTFPARGIVRIRHTYSPVLGGTNSVSYGLEAERERKKHRDKDEQYVIDEIDSLCLEPALKNSLFRQSQRNDMQVPFSYVDFILTTANTWKTPIEDFTLIVDRPKADPPRTTKTAAHPRSSAKLVSFCWDGPVERPDATHIRAHTTNFIPTKELRIGFISIDPIDP